MTESALRRLMWGFFLGFFLCLLCPPSSLYATSIHTGVGRQAGGRLIFPYSRNAAHVSPFELSVPRMIPDR